MMRIVTLCFASATLVLVLGVASVWSDLVRGLTEPMEAGPSASKRVLTVPEGISAVGLWRTWANMGLVRRSWTVEVFLEHFAEPRHLRPGEYALSPTQSALQLLAQVEAGDVVTYTVSIPEGARATEIAARLDAASIVDARAFLRAVRDPGLGRILGVEVVRLDGVLYPDVYAFAKNMAPEAVIMSMVQRLGEVLETLWPAAEARRLTLRPWIALASAIQRSPVPPKEWRLYSALLWTRREMGYRLEPEECPSTGPCALFGLERDFGRRWPEVEGAPGRSALRAAVKPASGVPRFLVRTDDGRTVYCVDLDCLDEAMGRIRRPVPPIPPGLSPETDP
ncbi:MAG: endolytic transglycosylase MltG [Myxococcota bacterium]